jgi:hypothetical protein
MEQGARMGFVYCCVILLLVCSWNLWVVLDCGCRNIALHLVNFFWKFITNLAHHELIMKIMKSSSIHKVCTFYTRISWIENTFNTWINLLMDEIQTYEWMNITRILHLSINLWVEYVFNTWYQCMKHTNYERTKVTWFPFLSHEMISLWC